MNHLDQLKNLRMGPPWPTAVRAMYRAPGDVDPKEVACWHIHSVGPVLDATDLVSLGWTTAEYSVLDDGSLSIIDPACAERHIKIGPRLFEDGAGYMRLGWPVAGYFDPAEPDRWEFVRLVSVEPAPPIDTTSTSKHFTEFQMSNGPSHISGTLIVHLSGEEIEEMMEDNVDQSPPFIEGGEIRATRSIQIKDVVEAAAEKVSPHYADMVADLEHATVRPDGGGDFLVEFTYDLDV